MSRLLLAFASAALAAALMTGTAMAGGFAIREQSAEGQGAAFAGVAAGTDGLSSMFWNPATMALHNDQGYISEWDAAVIAPYSR
ncbi:MAG: outer membrane protein transport protein, partial [Hyphomicrobiales bacterium]